MIIVNCRKSTELIDEYLLGSLSGSLRNELEKHISTCSGCKQELEDARLLHEALRVNVEQIGDAEWDPIEKKTLARLRAEMAKHTRESLVSKIAEFLRPVLRPQPRLVFALASTLVVVFALVLSLVWFQSSKEQLASGDSLLHRLRMDDGEAPRQADDQIASLMTGVDQILAEQNGEYLDESDADTTLDAIAQEADLGEVDLEAIDRQIHQYYDAWTVNGGYYSDILDASREEMESAIQAVFDASENGS